MVNPSENTLVNGIASSALFDLQDSHAVFTERGEDAYRDYQAENYDTRLAPGVENYDTRLAPGVAFSFIKRILSLNDLAESHQPAVEVVVLSRNDPETGA